MMMLKEEHTVSMWYRGTEGGADKHKRERFVLERFDRGEAERGQHNKQGRMQEYDHQLYWLPQDNPRTKKKRNNDFHHYLSQRQRKHSRYSGV